MSALSRTRITIDEQAVGVPVFRGALGARLYLPAACRATILIALPSGIGRLGRRERFGAGALAREGFATLLVDLLTDDEDDVRDGAHVDVPLLAERILTAARWLSTRGPAPRLPLGYLGVGPARRRPCSPLPWSPAVPSRSSRAGTGRRSRSPRRR